MEEAFPYSVKHVSTSELLKEICEDELFYRESKGGVTFSGGEPALQAEALTDVLSGCKERNIHVAIETACNYPFELLDCIFDYIDLFIVDCKAVSDDVHIKCTGRSNAVILENIKRLSSLRKKLWLRIPVVWNINISLQEMNHIGSFLGMLEYERVELIPYHKMGVPKYERYGLQYLLKEAEPPTKEQLQACCDVLKKYGVIATYE